ncbi:MAG: dicarboxylate transporter, DctP subunit [Clostridiales bacterium]|nr:dicarboxylate transporter, DctP subunit [Clostridiales bacterium]
MAKKRFIINAVLILVILLLSACQSFHTEFVPENSSSTKPVTSQSGSGAKKTILKLATVKNQGTNELEAAYHLSKLVSKRSNGEIQIQVFPSSRLGNQVDSLEGIKHGTIEMALINAGMMSIYFSDLELQKAISSYANEIEAMEDFKSQINQNRLRNFRMTNGIRSLAFLYEGFHMVWSKKPIRSLNDLKGLKIRVVEVKMLEDAFKKFGANPIQIPISQLTAGIQSGAVEAIVFPQSDFVANGYDKNMKYCMVTNHSFGVYYFIISEKAFGQLSKEQQQIITECTQESSDYFNERYSEI